MTEFYKGSVACTTGQSIFHVTHDYINIVSSYPVISLVTPSSSSGILIDAVTNKTPTGFDVVLSSSPTEVGYEINWLINVPGTDCDEYINDKRYYSKTELANPKLSRIHWKNIIAAPDLSPTGLQNNHNHDNRYFTESEIVPIIDSRISSQGSYPMEANTLMLRNERGRCQVNTPKVAADASNKGYVDGKFTSAQSLLDAETSARVVADNILQTQINNISGSNDILSSTLATTYTIATSVSALGGGEGVTRSTAQTINGQKTFSNSIIFSAPATKTIYFGDSTTDGSWAMGVLGGNFVITQRISGTWVVKDIVT
jgi:hypothetical protein